MSLHKHDLEITYYKAGGPGGQHRNKTETAVRIHHRPSGITVTASEQRSRQANLEKALQRMAARLAALQRKAPRRIATRPGKAAKERRLQAKRQHSERKRQRRSLPDA
ncbi:MAG: peptide chain release factor-like protein [Syntrophotalea acetylenica]|jgi:protein subunit release factor B|uniref:Peptidyl-tRNA hydrolase n=1 Tax=Syntrophotalea acetylenica TaxID=29542 RepID=A0A1L3GHC6_SYNAC|nr:peptide chain release factor-like protein [Syntrophotalea acetylenica]APG25078.1 peptidyl-tRNA hydrolase [Syntrophotalea acetylenica]APG43148.1 peptidyl-tRNA hydrolase [Syntrophotalea acetylenica]MDD4456678.1 peptide chain release factor-like protein [Syntrophotalea acetylenica]MDY0260927.1 peptide chain release factor-like protein [Syntrophotalea acetylenica]